MKRLTLNSVGATNSLFDYLERCGCVVARVGERTIETSPPPRSIDADLADLELEAYLHVWRELNPQVELSVVAAEPDAA
jgi:hypothetical protein